MPKIRAYGRLRWIDRIDSMLATQHPLYPTYCGMINRCKRNPRYLRKGVTVCDRWSPGRCGGQAEGFWNFVADVGERPEGMTLDRMDNSRGYSPENCRWATCKQQTANADLAVGTRHGQSKLSEETVRLIKARLAEGIGPKQIGQELDVKRTTVNDIKMGRTWRHIT